MAELGVEDSDVDVEVAQNCENFKGLLFDKPDEKYTDPETGAHFEYHDLCERISQVQLQ